MTLATESHVAGKPTLEKPRRRPARTGLWFIIVGLLLASLVAGLVWFNWFRGQMIAQYFANNKPPPALVSIAEAKSEVIPNLLSAVGDLAAVHLQQNRLDLADKELAEVSTSETKAKAPQLDTVITQYRLAELRRLRGDSHTATEIAQAALSIAQNAYGEKGRFTALGHEAVARALRDDGKRQDAIAEFRAALAAVAAYIPNAEHPLAATFRYELAAELLRDDSTRGEGLRLLSEAAAIREKFLGAEDPRTLEAKAAERKALAANPG